MATQTKKGQGIEPRPFALLVTPSWDRPLLAALSKIACALALHLIHARCMFAANCAAKVSVVAAEIVGVHEPTPSTTTVPFTTRFT